MKFYSECIGCGKAKDIDKLSTNTKDSFFTGKTRNTFCRCSKCNSVEFNIIRKDDVIKK